MIESLSVQRKRWRHRLEQHRQALWPCLREDGVIRLGRRIQQHGTTAIAFGEARDRDARFPFCIKAVPGADPQDFELTAQRLTWWHRHHPALSAHVPRIIASWPDERAMVMTREAGVPLGRHLGRSPLRKTVFKDKKIEPYGLAFGAWLHRFSVGRPPYGSDVRPMLGQRARLSPDGSLAVDAKGLLSNRIEQGHRAAHTLKQAGLRYRTDWSARFCLNSIERSVSETQPGGFVHGDVKPDNILVSGDHCALIDWWATPRVSWPITDLANFAGNLRLDGKSAAGTRLWESLLRGYFDTPPDQHTLATIELFSSILCLTYSAACVASKPSRFAVVRRGRRFLADVWAGRHRAGLST